MSEAQAQEVETLALPILYNPYIRGLEDSPELALDDSTLIAGRYRVAALIGKGSFSRVVQCYDHKAGRSVSVKVLHNDKDCIDQGIGEIRLLSLLAQRDPAGEVTRPANSRRPGIHLASNTIACAVHAAVGSSCASARLLLLQRASANSD